MSRVVAIDGPSGVGKSTLARRLARRLDLPYIDTGAMYRALALKALRLGLDGSDPEQIQDLVDTTRVDLSFTGGETRTLLDGEVVDDFIRTEEVAAMASALASRRAVREHLVHLQRRIASGGESSRDATSAPSSFPKRRTSSFSMPIWQCEPKGAPGNSPIEEPWSIRAPCRPRSSNGIERTQNATSHRCAATTATPGSIPHG